MNLLLQSLFAMYVKTQKDRQATVNFADYCMAYCLSSFSAVSEPIYFQRFVWGID